MIKGEKFKKGIRAVMKVFITVFILVLGICVIDTAATSWLDKEASVYQELYGENAVIGDEGAYGEDTPYRSGAITGANILVQLLGGLIVLIAQIINGLFEFGGIDLSIDGIIYGRLERNFASGEIFGVDLIPDMRMDIAHFGLETNNPWGIFGATLYYNLRDKFAFILVPVIFLFLLGKQLLKNGQKERSELKVYFKNVLFFLFIIMAMPYILEVYIYFRDVCMMISGEGLSSVLTEISGGRRVVDTASIFDYCEEAYYSSYGSLTDALLMLATALAGLFYLWDYIKIAALMAVGFGLFPLVMVWWFFKPKILSDWASIVFPALLTPFIDMLFMTLPAFISIVYQSVFGASRFAETAAAGIIMEITSAPKTSDVVLAVVLLIIIWNARAMRDRVLKLFGFEGMPRGNGLGMMMMLLMRGGKDAFGGSHGSGASVGTGGGTYNASESIEAADKHHEIGRTMEKADESIGLSEDARSMDEVFGSSGSETDEFLEEMNGEEGARVPVVEVSAEDSMPGVESMVEDEAVIEPVTRDIVAEEGDMGSASGAERRILSEDIADTGSIDGLQDVDDKGARASVMDTAAATQLDSEAVSATTDLATSVRGDEATVGVASDVKIGTNVQGVPDIKAAPLSADEREFVSSLSDRDKARFANLRQLDALEERASHNRKIMDGVGYSRGEYGAEQRNNARLSSEIEKAQSQQAELVSKRDKLIADNKTREIKNYEVKLDSYEKSIEEGKRHIETLQASKEQSDNKLKAWAPAHQASIENATYNSQIAQRREVERKYAFNSGLGGMKDTVFKDADDFRYRKEVEQIQKKHADYRNFDTKQYEGILTPEERETFYRERASRAITQKALQAVGVGAALVGGTAMAYGGTQSSMMGAAAGVRVTSVIGDKLEDRRISKNRTEDAPPVRTTVSGGTVLERKEEKPDVPPQRNSESLPQEQIKRANRANSAAIEEQRRERETAGRLIDDNRAKANRGMANLDD